MNGEMKHVSIYGKDVEEELKIKKLKSERGKGFRRG